MIVVTGANGFIGSAMVWELNQHGRYDILCVDSTPPEARPRLLENLRFEEFMTAAEFLPWMQTSAADKVTAIFHLGANSSTTEMNEDFLRANNTDYTRILFEAATRLDIPLLYASSAATYGDGSHGFSDEVHVDENWALNPYGRSKSRFDDWALKQDAFPTYWYGLRFFNVYGPNEYHKGDMASVVLKAQRQIITTGRLKLFRSHHPEFKDGEQLRDFVYVKDVTNWMWHLFSGKSAPSGIYNMGFGRARTWLDLAHAVFKEMGREMEIEWIDVPENIRPRYQYFTEAKMDKLFRAGLPKPSWSLEAGVHDYVQNYLNRNDRCLG